MKQSLKYLSAEVSNVDISVKTEFITESVVVLKFFFRGRLVSLDKTCQRGIVGRLIKFNVI